MLRSILTVCLYAFLTVQKKTELDPALVANISDPVVRDFFTVLAICNTVVVSTADDRVESTAGCHLDPPAAANGDRVDLQTLKYEAESPDESALVHVRLYIAVERSRCVKS